MLSAHLDCLLPAPVPAHDLQAGRHLALLAAITAAAVPLLVLLYHWLAFDAAAIAVLCAGTVMAASPLLLRTGASLALASNTFIAALFVLKIWLAMHLGGLGAATTAWFALCPLIAALLGGARAAIVWSALVFKVYVVLFLWDRLVGPLAPHPVRDGQVLALAGQLGLLVLVTVVALCLAGKPAATSR